MGKKYFDMSSFLEGISCLCLSFIMYWLLYTGKYSLYVTVKVKPFLYIMTIVLFIWGFFCMIQIGKAKYEKQHSRFLIFLIPILLLLLPQKTISASDSANSYSNQYFKQNTAIASEKETKNSVDNSQSQASTTGQKQTTASTSSATTSQKQTTASTSATIDNTVQLSGYDEKNKIITIADDEFYFWMVEIYTNLDKYAGYNINITGQVYKDETLTSSQFGSVRMLMSCCTADLVPTGPICNYDNASQLKVDSWITIHGVIQIGDFQGNKEFQINVKTIENASAPKDVYVYPF
ncbi:TIGR03943 family putative permease subunit [[Clostridium] fimetarium]|uniref:Putative membrane protein n=1 Tax=[Clostridium] fimetarium TaxID=99656 RepID=A0A1I0RUF1_9FIRM|nr:TIGR03943 family protein [[Clostridium] fimetarium]SEW44863.1 putative membrane protein [[Clostridium] fimetarium]